MSTRARSGTLHLARDFALLHGRLGVTTAHAHYAHQLLWSQQAPLRVLVDGQLQQDQRILIASMQPHAILDTAPEVLALYIEPLALALDSMATLHAPNSTANLLAQLQQLPRQPAADPRVASALAQVDNMLDGKVRAADIAAHVHLSLSQLERLFTRQVGLPVRRLVRWRRLRLALSLALSGLPLTRAAHDAGFADAAHFSRAMRETFGVRADQLLPDLKLTPAQ